MQITACDLECELAKARARIITLEQELEQARSALLIADEMSNSGTNIEKAAR